MTPPIILRHNLQPRSFLWLWAKYVHAVDCTRHCTNCLKGSYSKRFSGHYPGMPNEVVYFDEPQRRPWKAIYLCGVAKRGYPRRNYSHNCHAALVPVPGQRDFWSFEHWWMEVENASFTPIPAAEELPKDVRSLPNAFISCRIFRWAVVIGARLTA